MLRETTKVYKKTKRIYKKGEKKCSFIHRRFMNRRNSEGYLPQGLLQGGKTAKKNRFTQMCGNILELMKSCRSRGQSRKPMEVRYNTGSGLYDSSCCKNVLFLILRLVKGIPWLFVENQWLTHGPGPVSLSIFWLKHDIH